MTHQLLLPGNMFAYELKPYAENNQNSRNPASKNVDTYRPKNPKTTLYSTPRDSNSVVLMWGLKI